MHSEQLLLRRSGTFPFGSIRSRIANAVERGRWGFAEFFIISQTVLPALLYLPGTQPYRVLIRTSAFIISLLVLTRFAQQIVQGRFDTASQKWLVFCVVSLVLMIFHPTTNSLLAGIAQVMLYLSVLSPIFWAPRLKFTPERLRRLLFIILICSGVNAVVGILQVYDPGTWMPQDISSLVLSQQGGLNILSYVGPDGTRIIRPPGLSDAPGAVAGPATIAVLLGLIFCFDRIARWKRVTALLFAVAGFAAIFLSQVRTSLLVACGALVAYVVLVALRGQRRKALSLLLIAGGAFAVSFFLALNLGGNAVQERFTTLIDESPTDVYYSNRGIQVEYGFTTLLFDYPGGAGLGRWGMMRRYFGNEDNPDSPMIWAELQPNAWILDGGLMLLLFYFFAVSSAILEQINIYRQASSPALRFSAATIVAVNLTTVALIFGYTPFTTQVGLQFWFLAGLLHGVARDFA